MILAYHGVCPGNDLCVSPRDFRDHLFYLVERFKIVSLSEHLSGNLKDQSEGVVALTFDDAYKNVYDYALPILSELKLPATIYVPSGYVGACNEWDRGRHEPLMEIMDGTKLREVRFKGFRIGSHSKSHRRLSTLNATDLVDEAMSSKKALEDILGETVKDFAYPYGHRGDYDSRGIKALKEAGYRSAVTSCFGRHNNLKNKYALRRVLVWPTDNISVFAQKINGYFDWLGLKEAFAHGVKLRWIRALWSAH
jgi:peptidoglycan/xylan/chitin deacetylase (PgdA/CDA1 family)